jgi:hypothetical protein
VTIDTTCDLVINHQIGCGSTFERTYSCDACDIASCIITSSLHHFITSRQFKKVSVIGAVIGFVVFKHFLFIVYHVISPTKLSHYGS